MYIYILQIVYMYLYIYIHDKDHIFFNLLESRLCDKRKVFLFSAQVRRWKKRVHESKLKGGTDTCGVWKGQNHPESNSRHCNPNVERIIGFFDDFFCLASTVVIKKSHGRCLVMTMRGQVLHTWCWLAEIWVWRMQRRISAIATTIPKME